MTESKRTPSRVRTRFIAVLALITSGITFGSGFMVFLYMKSPAFENQLVEQVIKHMDWIVADELEKQIRKLRPKPVVDVNDPNKWFWEYIERRQKEQIEDQLNW
tara:strand:+ start:11531 stop:11842 length:312 start_codon:yes stop_codon:yes gene_type:complete